LILLDSNCCFSGSWDNYNIHKLNCNCLLNNKENSFLESNSDNKKSVFIYRLKNSFGWTKNLVDHGNKKDLLSRIKQNVGEYSIVIRHHSKDENSDVYRCKLFHNSSYVNLYEEMNEYPIQFRSFHEVICKNPNGMKLYFDIESNDNNIFSLVNFIDEFTSVLLKVFKIHFNIELSLKSDFIWMESIGRDINGRINKFSYHLVIKNYRILNHEQL
jgi:hypothetical protein